MILMHALQMVNVSALMFVLAIMDILDKSAVIIFVMANFIIKAMFAPVMESAVVLIFVIVPLDTMVKSAKSGIAIMC